MLSRVGEHPSLEPQADVRPADRVIGPLQQEGAGNRDQGEREDQADRDTFEHLVAAGEQDRPRGDGDTDDGNDDPDIMEAVGTIGRSVSVARPHSAPAVLPAAAAGESAEDGG